MIIEFSLLVLKTFLVYLLYTRVIYPFYKYWYYSRQGIPFTSWPIPFLGDYIRLAFFPKKDYSYYPLYDYFRSRLNQQSPEILCFYQSCEVALYINCPKLLEDVYLNSNKYFDKHDHGLDQLQSLVGKSILFSKSDDTQKHRRKTVAASLYKEKLKSMFEKIKKVTFDHIHKWKNGQQIDIVEAIRNLETQVILECAFGSGPSDKLVNNYQNGVIVKKHISQCIEENLMKAVLRDYHLINMLFPELLKFNITKDDRELKKNQALLREFLHQIVQDRKEGLNKNSFDDSEDLLTILLKDDYYSSNESAIIDECMTFFVASTQTTSIAMSNMLSYVIMNKDIMSKLQQEIDSILPSSQSLSQDLTFEATDQFDYLKKCFQESTRIEPPVPNSASHCFTQDAEIGKYKIKKGELLYIGIEIAHHNEKIWQKPHEFIPERFDVNSEFYKTSDGKQRPPFALIPFGGGKRICIGKTFTDLVSKTILPIVLKSFSMEFVDQKDYQRKRPNSIMILEQPQVFVKLKAREG